MQEFAAGVAEKCLRMEWLGVHWYGEASFGDFQQKMEKFHDMYQRPLLVTEFAPADWSAKTAAENKISAAMVLDFMKKALPWLEATPWIAGYAWFSFGQDSPAGTSSALFDEVGQLTMCGRYYASIRTDMPQGDLLIGTDQDPLWQT
jgi:Glycosyl hydrolase catalytic core